MTGDVKKWPETESLQSLTDSTTEKALEEDLENANQQLAALDSDATPLERAKITLAKMVALIGLNRKNQVWDETRPLLDIFLENDLLEEAIQTCDVLYQSHQAESTAALIQGIWLAVSFPVDPALTLSMLSFMVDETPKDSDGAALAAATAHYIAGIRASDEEFENMNFFTTNLLAQVAGNHSQIDSQESLDIWMKKLELNDPAVFLPRLGAALNIIVPENDWWFDRNALRSRFPQ